MPSDRLDIRDIPNQNGGSTTTGLSEHRESMSPVVQQLEKTAIGSAFPPRAESTASAHSFPGPPTPATNIASPQPQKALGTAAPPVQSPPPLAYNPAAPPAPEPIAHREKTPPPPDGSAGTGLAAAEKHEAVPQMQYSAGTPGFGGFQTNHQSAQSQGYFPGPPSSLPMQGMPGLPQGGMPPPPPGGPPGQQQPQFGGPHHQMSSPAPTSPPPHQQNFQRVSSFQAQPQTPGPTQFANYPQSPGFAPSIQSPGGLPTFHQQGQQPPTPSMPPPYSGGGFQSYQQQAQAFQQQQQQQQQQHTFAYSNYSYSSQPASQPQSHNAQGGYSGDVHSQAYRPTEQESMAHGKTYHPPEPTRWTQAQQPPSNGPIHQQGTGGSVNSTGSQGSGGFKLEERVGKMEKGVNKLFRKLDSKW
ncbi:hypothetical protein K431DRAFT_286835 [Polychaeton citri CBS 116435]|uniref:Uncharacterized protein n=1 Tax=Polychaeton citri CBS 116435 TaxID=1314669 RepID=A0A9P4Q4Y8_9PEZI|nr:hypothetical protein K431DRAFT_286835 [Polychaeton citri CBS 116435]